MRIAHRCLDNSRAQALYDNDMSWLFFYGYLNGHLISGNSDNQSLVPYLFL